MYINVHICSIFIDMRESYPFIKNNILGVFFSKFYPVESLLRCLNNLIFNEITKSWKINKQTSLFELLNWYDKNIRRIFLSYPHPPQLFFSFSLVYWFVCSPEKPGTMPIRQVDEKKKAKEILRKQMKIESEEMFEQIKNEEFDKIIKINQNFVSSTNM